MEFNNYIELRDYTEKFLTEDESEKLWLFLQKGMITPEKIVNITNNCESDEECVVKYTATAAWKTFFETHK